MSFRRVLREHQRLGIRLLEWIALAAPAGVAIGSAVALFLWLLDRATQTRWDHPWFLFLLPVAGAGIGVFYHRFGGHAARGNELIIEQIREPGSGVTPLGVPKRMAPLVLVATLLTHLFGGSAGREGTAVQMGGSIAATFGRWMRLNRNDTGVLLMCGIAAGFGAVFGTPLAGAVFAFEVLALGRLRYDALAPCLVAAYVGDHVTTAWGIQHTHYPVLSFAEFETGGPVWFDSVLLAKVVVAGVAFGLAASLFVRLSHGFAAVFKLIPHPALRPAVGGVVIIALVQLLGTRDYLGLGATPDPHHPSGVSIVTSFQEDGATPLSWWWKILFTTITLGAGFKGGEVTPLFFVGSTLGHTLAKVTNAPIDLFAALGFVAVFAGATKTPLACTIMAVELFAASSPGLHTAGFVIHAAVACFTAFAASGNTGVYGSPCNTITSR